MTTFQDPPPQSRRAVRQSERGVSEQPSYPPFSGTGESEPQRDLWDTTERRLAQLPQPPASPNSGRRAATPPPPAGEPLTYSTQGRVPSYDGPFRNVPAEPALPPTQALPKQDQPAYRVRDYAPPSFTPAPTWTSDPAAYAPPVSATPAVTPAGDLDYHTEVRTPSAPEGQTLTRRELRAMLQAEQADAGQPVAAQPIAPAMPEPAQPLLPEPVAAAEVAPPQPAVPQSFTPEPVVAEIVEEPRLATVTPIRPLEPVDAAEEKPWPFAFGAPAEAPAQPEAVAVAPFVAESVAPPPVDPQPAVPDAVTQASREVPLDTPVPADGGARALFGDIMTPIAPLTVAPEPQPNPALDNAMAEFDALAAAQPTRPAGHWSTQLDLEDETQPFESTINRKVGSGHAATNALVLPVSPERDIRGALTGTGEIMLTGSIDLPASLSSTGTTERHDHVGLDSLFESNDHELVPTDSQPVRAVRAVSTHHTGQGVTHTQKPKGTKVLTVLLFAAVGMAVVGVGLLVTVVVMNVL